MTGQRSNWEEREQNSIAIRHHVRVCVRGPMAMECRTPIPTSTFIWGRFSPPPPPPPSPRRRRRPHLTSRIGRRRRRSPMPRDCYWGVYCVVTAGSVLRRGNFQNNFLSSLPGRGTFSVRRVRGKDNAISRACFATGDRRRPGFYTSEILLAEISEFRGGDKLMTGEGPKARKRWRYARVCTYTTIACTNPE